MRSVLNRLPHEHCTVLHADRKKQIIIIKYDRSHFKKRQPVVRYLLDATWDDGTSSGYALLKKLTVEQWQGRLPPERKLLWKEYRRNITTIG